TLGGNAAVLIEAGGVRVLTDPWLSERVGPWRRARPCGFGPDLLQGVSAVLISHAHPDHLDPASLARVPRSTPVFCPHGTPLQRLRALAFCHVHPLMEWQSAPLELGPLELE